MEQWWSSAMKDEATTALKVYQIESTNACNLTCSFCPKFEPWNKRKIGFMNPDLIDRVDWSATRYTEVQFTGEPTLHKRLIEILTRIKDYGVLVGFSTNGTFKERLAAALEVADAVTVNDDEFRDPVFTERPNVFVQRLGDSYPIEDYSRQEPGEMPICRTPLTRISIHWNGDVVPCCKDHSGVCVFGNLWEQSFHEIEHGNPRKEFIRSMVTSRHNGLCEYCKAPNPHRIHARILEAIL